MNQYKMLCYRTLRPLLKTLLALKLLICRGRTQLLLGRRAACISLSLLVLGFAHGAGAASITWTGVLKVVVEDTGTGTYTGGTPDVSVFSGSFNYGDTCGGCLVEPFPPDEINYVFAGGTGTLTGLGVTTTGVESSVAISNDGVIDSDEAALLNVFGIMVTPGTTADAWTVASETNGAGIQWEVVFLYLTTNPFSDSSYTAMPPPNPDLVIFEVNEGNEQTYFALGEVTSVQIPTGSAKEDVVIDFSGSGLWAYLNDSNWVELNSGSPERAVAGDLDGNAQDDVIADYSPLGIWVRRNLGSWTKLHPAGSDQLTVGDLDNDDKDDLIVDFGPAGLWAYMNDTSWLELNSGSPEQVVTADVDGNGEDDVVGDFGASGIWIKRNQGAWSKLHPIGPEMIAVGDLDDNDRDDVLIDFGVNGLWAYMNDANWLKLLSNSPDLIATGDVDGNGADDILASFALSGAGLWQKLNLGGWSRLNTNAPDQMVTGDVDGSGKDDIIATFTSTTPGIFIKRNQAPWVLLNGQSLESLAVGNLDGQ